MPRCSPPPVSSACSSSSRRTPALAFAALAFAVAIGAPPAWSQEPAKQRLTLRHTMARVFDAPLPPLRWAPDGKHLMLREDGRTVYVDPLTGDRVDAALVGRAANEAERGSGRERERPGRGRRAEANGDRKVVAESPDGNLVAWVRGNNLFVGPAQPPADAASGPSTGNAGDANADTWAVSEDGGARLLYGILDWVYQEEVYGRGTWKAHWWSPDSRALAFLRLDEASVKEFTYIDHIPGPLAADKTVEVERMLYPKAGDPNPTVKLGIAFPHERKVVWADLSRFPADALLVRVGWTPDGKRVALQVQDRVQKWLELCWVDPATGAVDRVLREEAPAWVNVLSEPQWLKDGTFLWLSERTGYKHVYHYAANGELLAAVTAGEWVVRDVERVDEAAGVIDFTANKDGPVDVDVYRVGLDGKNLRRLTQDAGVHTVSFNHDGSLFLDRYSSLQTPPRVRLCKDDGTVVRVLAAAEPPGLRAFAFRPPELLQIPARDGFLMDATLIKPPDFDPAKRYAVWIETYSGPESPSVHDRWSGDAWEQFLAQEGYLVLQVNNRTSSARGQVYTSACYQRFGEVELQDLEDAVAWLCQNPWADASRVGISGWSYGGFMTAYALTHGKAFALGVAGAGVYDWRLYDTIYTERYMNTPEANPEGYARSSCIEAAKDLHGHLVLLHGTLDDNVHLQNTIRFAYELQKADKQFDMMLYPESMHGVGSAEQAWHLRQLIWTQIQRHLGPPR